MASSTTQHNVTERQRELWRLTDAGHGPSAIGRMLGITGSTVTAGLRNSAAAMGRTWPIDRGNGVRQQQQPVNNDPVTVALATVERIDEPAHNALNSVADALHELSAFNSDPQPFIDAERERLQRAINDSAERARAVLSEPLSDEQRAARDGWTSVLAAVGVDAPERPSVDALDALLTEPDEPTEPAGDGGTPSTEPSEPSEPASEPRKRRS